MSTTNKKHIETGDVKVIYWKNNVTIWYCFCWIKYRNFLWI